MSSRALERGMKQLLGAGALNKEKKVEEGRFEVEKLCWGLLFQTERETLRLPEVKVSKIRVLAANPHFDAGSMVRLGVPRGCEAAGTTMRQLAEPRTLDGHLCLHGRTVT